MVVFKVQLYLFITESQGTSSFCFRRISVENSYYSWTKKYSSIVQGCRSWLPTFCMVVP